VIAPGVAIRQGTLMAYGQLWRCKLTIEYNHLRFCRECLSYGYHSALHQILEMETCAVHRMPLLTRCAACDWATMGCHLSDSWIIAEFNCRRCHDPLGSKSAAGIGSCRQNFTHTSKECSGDLPNGSDCVNGPI
jgi:hypothetical protein